MPPRKFLETLDQPLPLQPGQPLQPEHTIELIDLMLMADRAQTVRLFGRDMALEIGIADADAGVTPDLVVNPGH